MSRHSGAQYTLTTPGGTITFNPTDYHGEGYYLDMDGMQFSADVAASRISRPQAHGAYAENGFEDGVTGIIKGKVLAASVASRLTLEANLMTAVRSLLGEQGTGTLAWTEPGGTSPADDRQIDGLRLLEKIQLEPIGGTAMGFQILLGAERSTAQSQTETTTSSGVLEGSGGGLSFPSSFSWSFTGSSGGVATVTNAGTATAYPKLRIYGTVSAPTITHVGTGAALVFTGSVGVGEYLEVDLFDRTVKLNGGVNRMNLLDIANSAWFGLTAGSNVIRLSGGSYDTNARLDVVARDAYVA